jgi:hypothetical protein
MAQILKLTKKVNKVEKSGRIVIQSTELKKYVGKNVIIRISTN